MKVGRRTLAAGLGAAGALAATGAWLARTEGTSSGDGHGHPPRDTPSLLDALLQSSSEECIHVAAAAMKDGLDANRVLSAALLMPLVTGRAERDIHAMAVVPAVRRLIADEEAPAVPTLWTVAHAHAWSRAERVTSSGASVVDPDHRLSEALITGNSELAGDAAASWFAVDPERAYRRLTLELTAERSNPHVAIWAAMAGLELARTRDHAPLVVRSVARHASHWTPRPSPAAHLGDPNDSTSPEDIVRALRSAPETPIDGLNPAAIWAALALLTAETRLRHPGVSGIGIHQTTLLEALWRGYDGASSDDQPIILGRAARWMVALHTENPGSLALLDILPGPGDPFAAAGDDIEASYRAALREVAADLPRYRRRLRGLLRRRGNDPHDYKYWAALETIGAKLTGTVADRWWASGIAARFVRDDEGWERFEEAQRIGGS
ncbi:MAG: hypothetical protein AAGF12_20790 [Myxococcota bacterium]